MSVLMIDNYDSFTYNLVQYLQALGAQVRVIRNDELSADEIERLAPERIVISPGPCTPDQAGVSLDVIRRLGATTPILGVCLGHQSLGQAYGSCVQRPASMVPGWGAALDRLGDHAEASARLAAAAGCTPRTVELIRHQEAPVDPVAGRALLLADEAN